MRQHFAAIPVKTATSACFLSLLIGLAIPTRNSSADDVNPSCIDQLAAFAQTQGIAFEPRRVSFSPRWAGAGHEVRRLPGITASIPADHCGAVLSVDLNTDCRIVKSRGKGACRKTFPLEFH